MISFAPATPGDDADLRALLRENSMASWVTMAVEREPSFFSGIDRFGRDHPVVAREHGCAVGMYVRSEHPVHVNGRPLRIGYLGALRIHDGYRRRVGALRDGYVSAFAAGGGDPAGFCYTCIASENRAARRLLEANLNGMPRYLPVGEVIALALPRARGRSLGHWQRMRPEECLDTCRLHNRIAASRQFSPVLDPTTIASTGADFFVCRGATGQPTACMALWNQNAYKQVVARAYRQPLAALRPLYNACAAARRRVALPQPGRPVDQTYLAFLAADGSHAPPLADLVGDALAICDTSVLTLGIDPGEAIRQEIERRFRPRSYAMTVYTVSYAAPPDLDGRPTLPEIAVL